MAIVVNISAAMPMLIQNSLSAYASTRGVIEAASSLWAEVATR